MKFLPLFTVFAFALLTHTSRNVECAKILAVYPFPGKSHFMTHNTLIKELIERGHQVTAITSLTLKHLNLGNNYTEVLIEPVYNFWADVKSIFGTKSLFDMTHLGIRDFIKLTHVIGVKTTEHALKQPNVQSIINEVKTDGVYDLLLAEQFYQEAFLAFAYKFNIPIVLCATFANVNFMSQQMGVVTPWSFVPHGYIKFSDRMNFYERLENTIISFYDDFLREFDYFPQMDELVETYFSHLQIDIPKVSLMEKNASLMLINDDAAFSTIRPRTNAMISIGGLHIYPPKPLPTDLKKFLDAAVDGVIFFSMGSNVQSKDMPIEYLKIFLEVFASLKQRVLWKFEDDQIKNLPSNVMIRKWLPQNDILAHPNVKLFITHGGLLSTQEGVYHGTPMLGLPIYNDQHINMNKAVLDGYGISLRFQSITKEVLTVSLNQLLENPKYKANAQRISNIFRDRPENPRDTAMYWIEYVIRHKGAKHLRSAALDLKWYQLYLLDVIAFIVGILLLIIFALYKLLKFFISSKNSKKVQQNQSKEEKRKYKKK